jgi:c-di-GMP-binding flagellar brake protein YcgR
MRTWNHCCAQNIFRYKASAQVSTVKLVQIDTKRRMLVDVSLGGQGRHSEALVSVGRSGACRLTKIALEQDQDHKMLGSAKPGEKLTHLHQFETVPNLSL